MLLFLSYYVVIFLVPTTIASTVCPIDYHCNDTYIHDDNKVNNFCTGTHKYTMIGRCCSQNNSIIGLDLRYCDVKVLNISHTFSNLEILDLRENDYKKFTADELIGLLKLNDLYLSAHIPCPGGDTAWNHTRVTNTTTYCSQQLDYCQSLKHINITCGTGNNAKCVHTGPGSATCDCQEGYFGYKCLQQGIFPTTVFITSVSIPAVVLSVVLWFVQGKDPYRRISIIEE